MTGKHSGIDLRQQFIEVFNREEMLAFFDFRAKTGLDGFATGLCKISKPKEGASNTHYFSLLFIIETPDEETWHTVDTWFSSIDWDTLRNCLPEFESVLSIPFALQQFTGNFFQEIDIYVREETPPSRSFILGALFPAVRTTSGIEAGEPIFWEDLPPSRSGENPENRNASLLERLQNLIRL